jgi:serine protein kinase
MVFEGIQFIGICIFLQAYTELQPCWGGVALDILGRIAQFRSTEEQLAWSGTFAQYLELVRERPYVAMTAHERVYDMIRTAGITTVDGVTQYHFFQSAIFGLERTLERLVEEYFHSAARRLDVRKRILLLMGPVSGGKSTIVTLLKRGLEQFSRTDRGAVYAIEGCPMHEEPLHLIPQGLRAEVERALGVRIEGNLCPACQMRLRVEYGGRMEEMRVRRVLISEEQRIGIGTFSPSDPKSQDIADLTGSIDFSTIAQFGSESDPRAYRFDGELNKANRGIMEFQEMLKCDEKFLWHLLSLTQEGNFKAGRYALISADELIIAHTNEAEYKSFIANKKNEALQSRMIVMPIPYNLRVTDEEKIYTKLIENSDMSHIHLAPHALRAAAMFSVMTRLKPSKQQGMDLVKKMKLYDEATDMKEIQHDFLDDGMSGVDPRYVMNRISSALVRQDVSCVNAFDVLRALKDGMDQHPSMTRDERERYLDLIALARKEYDTIAKKEVQKAFIYSYEASAKTLFDNYLDHIDTYCNGAKKRDPLTGETLECDERLMRQIEEQIGVSENAKRAFREEILIRISAYARQGKTFDYSTHDRLREAIENKLFADLKDLVKLTTSTRTPDEIQRKKMNEVAQRLIDKHGYCSICSNEVLRYVGSLLYR